MTRRSRRPDWLDSGGCTITLHAHSSYAGPHVLTHDRLSDIQERIGAAKSMVEQVCWCCLSRVTYSVCKYACLCVSLSLSLSLCVCVCVCVCALHALVPGGLGRDGIAI